MAAKEFIVAIELGSSKMTGIAGKKNLDGSITVLAVVTEESSSFIRKGVVYNIDKTAQCISNIVKKLTNTLKTEIAYVYVGVGGQSIRSVRNNIVKNLPEDTIVTQEMVNELMDGNRNMSYQDQEILDAATQEYKVDNQYQMDPVGIQCTRLEGNFLNILWRNDMYLAPLALADSVLTDAEKRSGCVLVDLGADTTTVSVYFKNVLRHLAVIPLGGNNVTKDIASLQMEESHAEQMKLKYGSAFTDNSDIDNSMSISIDNDRSIESRKLVEIVEGRVQEIVENVWYQVPSEYAHRLLGGIVLTGGGSNMKNIETAFRNHTHIEKIRTAKFVTQTITAKDPIITARDGKMNTVLGILAKGDMNCAGEEVDPTADLFTETKPATTTTTADIHREPRKVTEIGQGVVLTEAEKLKAEEEKRRQEEEAAAKAAAEAAALAAEEEKDNGLKAFGKKLGNFIKKMVAEE